MSKITHATSERKPKSPHEVATELVAEPAATSKPRRKSVSRKQPAKSQLPAKDREQTVQSVGDPRSDPRTPEDIRTLVEASDAYRESKGIDDTFYPSVYLILFEYKGTLMVSRESIGRRIGKSSIREMKKSGMKATLIKVKLAIDTVQLPDADIPTSFRVSQIQSGSGRYPLDFELARAVVESSVVSIKQVKQPEAAATPENSPLAGQEGK